MACAPTSDPLNAEGDAGSVVICEVAMRRFSGDACGLLPPDAMCTCPSEGLLREPL